MVDVSVCSSWVPQDLPEEQKDASNKVLEGISDYQGFLFGDLL